MNWTKEQTQAIYEKGSNILVAAAAGSGKTAVLVERIINKIIKEKINIDNLLVVTFTNAAASEMRERILEAIYKILDSEDEKDEEEIAHLQKQVNLLNKASICTIDSFCLDVIRNNFFEIDISPNFRIADSAEIDLIKQEVLENLFEEKYENHDEDFESLIKIYTSYKDDTPLKELILKIYTYIESNPYPFKWLHSQVERFNIDDLSQDFSKTVWGEILLKEIEEEIEDDIKKLKSVDLKLSVEKELEKCAKTIELDISQLETLKANLDNWDKAYVLAENVEFKEWPKVKTNLQTLKDESKAIRDKIKKSFYGKRDKIFTSKSQEANQDLIDMYKILSKLEKQILEFDKRFREVKKERNIVDFSDIEHLALKILIDEDEFGNIKSSKVAENLKEKYYEIAIDEYQDSNLVQEYILTSISKGNNIFMVGDVKQSIYKFRQAMPDLFLNKYKNYAEKKEDVKEGQKIKLFKNFRSRKNVLDFTNLIFENIMQEKLGQIDYTEEEYLNLGANYETSKEDLITEIDILKVVKKEEMVEEKEDDDEEFKEEQERIEDIELEAKFVAKKIRDLIDSKFQIYDNKKGYFRDIKYKDIVILLRSTKNKAPVYEKALLNQDINVFSDTSSEYLDSYEIQTIMNLLKIIDNPYQDIPLVQVMRSSIGGFTDNDLVEIRLCDQNDDFYTAMLKAKLSVTEDLRQKIEMFLDNIQNWRDKINLMDLDEFIWNIYEDTGFLNYVTLLPNGHLRKANLTALFERAKKYEKASFKGLFNFINFIEKIHLGSGDLGSAKLIGENEDVVRIMSIHKSKGLEFPVVFLSSTGTQFNLMDLNNKILLHQNLGIGVKYIDYDKQIKYDTLTKLALRSKLLEENLAEEMRILYVALTRAKEKLYITAIEKDFEKELEKMQDMVNIYKKEDEKINPILIKKYKKYIEWILLVNLYNQEYSKEMMKINVYSKEEAIKLFKIEEKEEIDIFKILEENSQNVKSEDLIEIKNKLEFEYKYKDSIAIPTKASVTSIVHNNLNNELVKMEKDIEKIETEDEEELEIQFPKPKFLIGSEEEKITSADKGSLMHLIFKNLEFNKQYEFEDIKNLIKDLQEKAIITEKQASAINIKQILQFTKTKIFESLKSAKEYHKEEPFYINVKAKDVVQKNIDEEILVQGIIDLYYIDKDDKLVLLDYKTDYVKQGEEEILINRHKAQLELYKEALENSLQRKVDKVYIYSTVLGKEINID